MSASAACSRSAAAFSRSASSCATAAAPSARSFLLARFLCGVAEGGVPTTSFGWAGEFLLPRHKTRVGIVLQMGFQLGSLLFTVSFSALGAAAADVYAADLGIPSTSAGYADASVEISPQDPPAADDGWADGGFDDGLEAAGEADVDYDDAGLAEEDDDVF